MKQDNINRLLGVQARLLTLRSGETTEEHDTQEEEIDCIYETILNVMISEGLFGSDTD